MRYATLLFGLILIAGGFAASSDASAQLEQCVRNCCSQADGTWTGDDCVNSDEELYNQCSTSCISSAFGSVGCCGPAALLAGVAALAVLRR
jgi:hypothetical protein